MKAIVYNNLTLLHKRQPIQFKIGIGVEGNLINGRIKNIDLNKLRSDLEIFNFKLRDKEITELFSKFRGMETIALYYLDNFNIIDFVEIIENNTEKIIINKNDL